MRAGEVIDDRFEIDRLIGAGGMGQVYLVRDLATGEPAAIKVLLGAGQRSLQRFAREVELLASLRVPGVVRHIAHGTTAAGQPYLVMEWLEGETLAERLERGPLSVEQSVELVRSAAKALGEVHRLGVVHRDIKPSNLMLVGGETERVTLLDFGVAKTVALDVLPLTASGALVGTPAYMAPEQVRGMREIDPRADVFALGCVLYECLSGRPAFFETEILKLLMQVILGEPPRLRELRPGVPEWLDGFVGRMLSKSSERRPRDAGAVAVQLAAPEDITLAREADPEGDLPPSTKTPGEVTLMQAARAAETASWGPVLRAPSDACTIASDIGTPVDATAADRRITHGERKVLCLVLAEFDDSPLAATLSRASDMNRTSALHEIIARHGAELDLLHGRWLLAMVTGAGEPTELAVRAARCALAIRGLLGEIPISVTTGRAEADQPEDAGELIERAILLLASARTRADGMAIPMDGVTGALVEQRFDVLQDASGYRLLGTRDELAPVRRLLGKATDFVGRDHELTMLIEEVRHCVEERIASAVLITGPAGGGKSRLCHELLSRVRAADDGVAIWTGEADPMSAGSALALLANALRRMLDIREGEPIEARRRKVQARVERHRGLESSRVAAFLGELIGVPFPDHDDVQLRAARANPMLMGDQIRLAWEEFLGAECAVQPIVLVLEDLHWGDLPTVELVNIALRRLHDVPFLVLALARPEVHEVFPNLWKERGGQEHRLKPISRRASERMVRQVLGDAASDTLVARLVEHADGNAFYLEELIRSAAAGNQTALPETVLAMVHARFEALPPDARRVLRTVSLFGELIWQRVVTEVLGGADVTAQLADLEGREILTRRGVGQNAADIAYTFRHSLLREAAYGMLTDRDRRAGHALAGAFLERGGDADPMVLAEHFRLGGEPVRAALAYLQAAEQALRASDLGAAIERAERGLSGKPDQETAGALRLVQAEAHHWRGELILAEKLSTEAVGLLSSGSAQWFYALEKMVTAACKLGNVQTTERWVVVARDASVAEGALNARNRCLGMCASMLALTGDFAMTDTLIAAIEETISSTNTTDFDALAWLHQARAFRAVPTGDVGATLQSLEEAVSAFEQAGDRRFTCVARSNLAFMHHELGDYHAAEMLLRTALASAEHMGLHEQVAITQGNLCHSLSCVGKLNEAKAVGEAALGVMVQMEYVRVIGSTRVYLAQIALFSGDLAAAEREARAAAEVLQSTRLLRPLAIAVLARALLGLGRVDEALDAARDAHAALEANGVEEGEGLIRLTFAEALDAAGRQAEAARAITAAEAALLARADKLSDPRWRASFLNNVPEHARTRELARLWLDL